MNADQILDSDLTADNSNSEYELISVWKFILLSVMSFGLYGLWWSYKSWKYFKMKESLNIVPAVRGIFSIIFLYHLFSKIQIFAKSTGYRYNYPVTLLYIGAASLTIFTFLPSPYWAIAYPLILCFIPPVKAINFSIDQSNSVNINRRSGFSTRQYVIVVIGVIMWILVIIDLLDLDN